MLSETREGPNTPVGGPEKPGKYVTPHVGHEILQLLSVFKCN